MIKELHRKPVSAGLKNGEIVPVFVANDEKLYDPTQNKNLPSIFAKVDDEATALRFVGTYGHLGYCLVCTKQQFHEKQARGGRISGDPVGWVLYHAKAVRFVLKIISALEYDRGLKALLINATYKVEKASSKSEHDYVSCFYDIPKAGKCERQCFTCKIGKTEEETLRNLAICIVVESVFFNTEGSRVVITEDGEGGITSYHSSNSLIEVIWALVGEIAILVSKEEQGFDGTTGFMRECLQCHSLFFATHGRQKFCPPSEGSSESTCGRSYRMNKLRKRGKV